MKRGFSIYLDALRFIAALVVLASHMGYSRFTDGKMLWIRDLNLGSDAVILFFVLSGFVIAWTTFQNRRSAQSFTLARFTRLYSVVIPALLITILLDQLGSQLFPERYDGWWYNALPPAEHLLRGLSFSTQISYTELRLGTNGPFWSVAYEAWYYLAFGLAVYLKGFRKWLALALVAFIAGPRILLLAPCWLMGVGLYKFIETRPHTALSKTAALICFIAPWLIYVAFLMLDTPKALEPLSYALYPGLFLGFSNEYLWNTLIGALFTAHFLGAYALLKDGTWIGANLEKAIRWCAGATFSIYLFHYPVMTFLYAIPVYEPGNVIHGWLLSIATLMVCFLLAEISERRLLHWKTFFAPRQNLQLA